MTEKAPIIVWFRRDFRFTDHPALAEAAASSRPVIPVYVLDEVAENYGAAPKWRLGEALRFFGERLEGLGSRLILRRGTERETLIALARETNAGDIWWTRAYDPEAISRDTAVKSALKSAGYGAKRFAGHVLFDPWNVKTKQGGYFKVYSPMWHAVQNLSVSPPLPSPKHLSCPDNWPGSERLEDWSLDRGMDRGASVVARYAVIGEAAAKKRLSNFVENRIACYKIKRDFFAENATSRLSENLAWGEIGPRVIWHSAKRALHEGVEDAEHFLKELAWREFAYHLVYHSPKITSANWRRGWDAFPWSEDEDEAVMRWKQGRTDVPLVDAAMRELYVTGYMHNRGRMITGSYLTKHMLKHWKIGAKWFADCLVEWDPASNAMGWQWVAGSGPDAAPYFRIFNPETQAQKFDPDCKYVSSFVAEISPNPSKEALAFFEACPRAWKLTSDDQYPDPVVALDVARNRALAAYQAR